MGVTDYGTQTISFRYNEPGRSEVFNKLNYKIIQKGIYEGGLLSYIDATTVQLSPFISFIEDTTTEVAVRLETAEIVNLTVSTAAPYIVLRFDWANAVNNFADVLAVAEVDIQADDLIVGRCNYDGNTLQTDFEYGRRSSISTDGLNKQITNLKKGALDTEIIPKFIGESYTNLVTDPLDLTSGSWVVDAETTISDSETTIYGHKLWKMASNSSGTYRKIRTATYVASSTDMISSVILRKGSSDLSGIDIYNNTLGDWCLTADVVFSTKTVSAGQGTLLKAEWLDDSTVSISVRADSAKITVSDLLFMNIFANRETTDSKYTLASQPQITEGSKTIFPFVDGSYTKELVSKTQRMSDVFTLDTIIEPRFSYDGEDLTLISWIGDNASFELSYEILTATFFLTWTQSAVTCFLESQQFDDGTSFTNLNQRLRFVASIDLTAGVQIGSSLTIIPLDSGAVYTDDAWSSVPAIKTEELDELHFSQAAADAQLNGDIEYLRIFSETLLEQIDSNNDAEEYLEDRSMMYELISNAFIERVIPKDTTVSSALQQITNDLRTGQGIQDKAILPRHFQTNPSSLVESITNEANPVTDTIFIDEFIGEEYTNLVQDPTDLTTANWTLLNGATSEATSLAFNGNQFTKVQTNGLAAAQIYQNISNSSGVNVEVSTVIRNGNINTETVRIFYLELSPTETWLQVQIKFSTKTVTLINGSSLKYIWHDDFTVEIFGISSITDDVDGRFRINPSEVDSDVFIYITQCQIVDNTTIAFPFIDGTHSPDLLTYNQNLRSESTFDITIDPKFLYDALADVPVFIYPISDTSYLEFKYDIATDKFTVNVYNSGNVSLSGPQFDNGTSFLNLNQKIRMLISLDLSATNSINSSRFITIPLESGDIVEDSIWSGTPITNTDGFDSFQLGHNGPNDPSDWTDQGVIAGDVFYASTFGNGIYVMGSDDNLVYTSSDGITWAAQTLFSPYSIRFLAYGNGVFVAINSQNGGLYTATDPNGTWTSQGNPGSGATQVLIFGGGQFVFGDTAGHIHTSPDGINWTDQGIKSGYTIEALGYGAGLYVMSNADNWTYTSPDGITWFGTKDITPGHIRHIVYGDGEFLATTDDIRVITSPDGINWSDRGNLIGGISYSLAYGNGLYVTTAVQGHFFTSTDGIKWTDQGLIASTYTRTSVFGNNKFILGTDAFKIFTLEYYTHYLNANVESFKVYNSLFTEQITSSFSVDEILQKKEIAFEILARTFVSKEIPVGASLETTLQSMRDDLSSGVGIQDNTILGRHIGTGEIISENYGETQSRKIVTSDTVLTNTKYLVAGNDIDLALPPNPKEGDVIDIAATGRCRIIQNNANQAISFKNSYFTTKGDTGYLQMAQGEKLQMVYQGVGESKLETPVRLPELSPSLIDNVRAMSYTPDGKYLATSGDELFLQLYRRDNNTLTKLPNAPTTSAASYGADFSPDGEYLAVSMLATPWLRFYKRDEDKLEFLQDGTAGNYCYDIAWSPDGRYVYVAFFASPWFLIYRRDGDTFTQLAQPASLPASNTKGADFSRDGKYLAMGHQNTPYIAIYKRHEDTLTKLSNPSTIPSNVVLDCAFSPDGNYLAAGYASHPYFILYKVNHVDDTFTALPTDPAISSSGQINSLEFSRDGKYLLMATSSVPRLAVFKLEDDILTRVPNVDPVPDGTPSLAVFSPDSNHITVSLSFAPFLEDWTYKEEATEAWVVTDYNSAPDIELDYKFK